jgi:putative CocE/NonD family hydrolase
LRWLGGHGHGRRDPGLRGGSTLLPSLDHGPRDQAPVIARGDALSFASETLIEPVRLRAAASVHLQVATSGADTDFAVRLTDVDPDGVHLLVGDGIGRLKLRDDLGAPAAVVPGQVYALDVTLANELAYTFQAGHRVGLIVSSSNYPRFTRNPNDGKDFYVDEASSVTVTNSLFLGADTRLVLPAGQ